MNRQVALNRVSATCSNAFEVPEGWENEEDESPWICRDATNDCVQPVNDTGGGGRAAFVAVDKPGRTPSGYAGGTSGHGHVASRDNDPDVNEGETHQTYSPSWEGYEETGWRTRVVKEFIIRINVMRSE